MRLRGRCRHGYAYLSYCRICTGAIALDHARARNERTKAMRRRRAIYLRDNRQALELFGALAKEHDRHAGWRPMLRAMIAAAEKSV